MNLEEFAKIIARNANNQFLKGINLVGFENQLLIAEAKNQFNEAEISFDEGSKPSEATYEEWQTFLFNQWQPLRRRFPQLWNKRLKMQENFDEYLGNCEEDGSANWPFKLNPEREVYIFNPKKFPPSFTSDFLEITFTPNKESFIPRDKFTPNVMQRSVLSTVEWSMHFEPWVSKGRRFEKAKSRKLRKKLAEAYLQNKQRKQICNRFEHSATINDPVEHKALPVVNRSYQRGQRGKFSAYSHQRRFERNQLDKNIREQVREHEKKKTVKLSQDKLDKMQAYQRKIQSQRHR
ncbi:Oidioi.mRNA.OKI2018_I69.XSR.g16212.t1.cds [Oikopleura dioica]|uniref:Oidioi.mRNA.OKI2018_I69.XSR.g16212.t1.cds n=1 Tax=Oikopleura dioica TaxID=34765 RepID=A0ABN7SLP9_OIKDI|nr:Oidioi.mRNA.OKI2018_I69.XSR.g16212.t1.cds [Oikopleura dioica]